MTPQVSQTWANKRGIRRLAAANSDAFQQCSVRSDYHYSWQTECWSNTTLAQMLGEELKKARQKAKLTQEQLAFDAGISRNYVSLLERNQKSPTVDVLIRLCKAMDVSAGRLILKVEKAK